MHTAVLNWFGLSAVWFLPLLWRLAKAALPGGVSLRGPGTIRLWLGFVSVLIASCALEAALASGSGSGHVIGRAVLAGVGHVLAPTLGATAAPLTMLVLFAAGLPWLLAFRWLDALAAADRALGLGLGISRVRAKAKATRGDDARGRPGAIAARVATTNPMAPKSAGRYARPTAWRPPTSSGVSRGASAALAASATHAAAQQDNAATYGPRLVNVVPRASTKPASTGTVGVPARETQPVSTRSNAARSQAVSRAPDRSLAGSPKSSAALPSMRHSATATAGIRPATPTPTPGVLETLRAIEANAAQWTTLAGVSLARSGASPAQASSSAAKEQAFATDDMSLQTSLRASADRTSEQPATAPTTFGMPPIEAVDEPAASPAPAPPHETPNAAQAADALPDVPPHDAQNVHSPHQALAADASDETAPEADTAPTPDVASATPRFPHEPEPPLPGEPLLAHATPPSMQRPAPAEPDLADAEPPHATHEARSETARPFAAAANEPSPVERIDETPTTSASPPPAQPSLPSVRGYIVEDFAFHAPVAPAIELPSLDLLERASADTEPIPAEQLAQTGQLIEQRLQEFKVPVTVVGASAGPVITRFEVEPALGVRGSQIVGLMKDLSRGLGLTSIRVVETIPGKTCMGLELPNAKRQMIRLSEILDAGAYRDSGSLLTIAMGKDITGQPIVTDLAKAPHMLVAGTTGSGKSVAINAMILSLLYKASPEDVRLIMIDPKMLELSVYEGIAHLLAPVVTDMKLAANALTWCVGEMEKRYRLMSAVGVRNLAGFNQKVRDAERAGKKLTNPFSLTPDAPEPLSTLPFIVVVIDELADLMMVAGKKIEELIARLAQKARAAGIHLILATQRPSVDVITGLIKANIPTRVAFQVSSKIDSRTILDQMGAESLLGQGDMLFLPPGTGYPQRVHGAFVADEEVHRVVEHLKQFGEPQYEEGILDGPATDGAAQDIFGDAPDAEADPLYDEAVAFVVRTRRASISSVQRQLRIGYNRAARLVEQMEAAGLVSSMSVNGSREVLAPPERDG